MNRAIKQQFGISHFNIYNATYWLLISIILFLIAEKQSITFAQVPEVSNLIVWPLSAFLGFWALSYLAVYIKLRIKKQPGLYIISIAGFAIAVIQSFIVPIFAILLVRLLTKNDLRWDEVYHGGNWAAVFGTTLLFYLYFGLLVLLAKNKKLEDLSNQTTILVSELDHAQLNELKMQMRPHFLFNVLNTIAMMIRQGRASDATEVLSSLSDMLRMSLDNNQQEYTSLGDEIALIKKLLVIEKYRFEDRLSIEVNIEKNTESCLVPTLIFQPLVENAFKHGVAKTIGQAEVKICCYLKKEDLYLEVFNTGPNLPHDWELQKYQNIGLANTSSRLARLYSSKSRLIIEEKENGILVTIILPSNK